jgi:TPR repeat protein
LTAAAGARPAAELEACYRRACRLNVMDQTALRRLLGADPAVAAPWVQSAARQGLPQAMLRLGQMRLDGLGVDADPAIALDWFARAADAGSAEAMNMVGRCHDNGWGTPVDLGVAAAWYRRSAEAGHDWGQYNLGHMLFDGRGVAQDQPQAVLRYERAARQGHGRAMSLLSRCYEEGWGVQRDLRQAWRWCRRSAETGYFRAQFNLASFLADAGDVVGALEVFESALSGAPPEGLATMTDRLAAHPDPRLSALGRRYAPQPHAARTLAPQAGASA